MLQNTELDLAGAAGPSPGVPLTIPLAEELVRIDKVRVDRGGIRLTKRVETREQRVEAPLAQERVEVERRPIGRTVDRVPDVRQEGDTLIVPIVEEVLVTEKRLVLVEEVRITRHRSTQHHIETVSLRSEHAEVERLAPDTRSGLEPT